MASERQIAANRRNARRSTGPRTKSGKERAGGNACRHGLRSRRMTMRLHAREIEDLACEIAGRSRSPTVMELARTAAEAELDLVRVRRTRAALIEQVTRSGRAPVPLSFGSLAEARLLRRWLKHPDPPPPEPDPNGSARLPPKDADRTADAARRLLPQLMVLSRYEQRAWSRREHALLTICTLNNTADN